MRRGAIPPSFERTADVSEHARHAVRAARRKAVPRENVDHATVRCHRARRRRGRAVLRRHRRPARPARAAARPCGQGGREDPDLRRRALQLHQPRLRRRASFLSDNPAFCRSALARYTPDDFIALVRRHGIAFHEKHRGQLFCDGSAEQIIAMLLAECAAGAVQHWQPCAVHQVRQCRGGLRARHRRAAASSPRSWWWPPAACRSRRSAPPTSATGWRGSSGIAMVEPRPALVPLTFDAAALGAVCRRWPACRSRWPSRPAAAQSTAALPRRPAVHPPRPERPGGAAGLELLARGTPLRIDLAPGRALAGALRADKTQSRRQLGNELAP